MTERNGTPYDEALKKLGWVPESIAAEYARQFYSALSETAPVSHDAFAASGKPMKETPNLCQDCGCELECIKHGCAKKYEVVRSESSARNHTIIAAEAASAVPCVAVPLDKLQHWSEYWNRSTNQSAMHDALEHILGEIDALLREAER